MRRALRQRPRRMLRPQHAEAQTLPLVAHLLPRPATPQAPCQAHQRASSRPQHPLRFAARFAAGFAATMVGGWDSNKCGTLPLEAEALNLFGQIPVLARGRPAAKARWRSLFLDCSRPLHAAMDTLSRLGVLESHAHETLSQGLCMAMPILVRMARADPSPRMVQQVLALWVREVEMDLRLDEPTGAALGLDERGYSPAAAASDDSASSVFSEMPALESAVFHADMRASARSAPLEARRVFHAAMATALEQVRARPSGVDIRDALALRACLAAARWAHKAAEAKSVAIYDARDGGERRAAAKAAIKAMGKAEEAFKMAAYHVGAALEARRNRVAGALPMGPGSAPHASDQPAVMGMPEALSVEAAVANVAAWESSAAEGDDEPAECDHMTDDSSEEPDEVEAALDSIVDDDYTKGRNMCAPAGSQLPWGSSLKRMPRLPSSKGVTSD